MDQTPKSEQPCEIDNQPCQWVCEEFYDDFGDLSSWDLYCDKCYRYRDFALNELLL